MLDAWQPRYRTPRSNRIPTPGRSGEPRLEKIVHEPEPLARYSIRDLVALAGTQGPELIQWLVMRGALGSAVRERQSNYHVPISNTGSGLLLLEKVA